MFEYEKKIGLGAWICTKGLLNIELSHREISLDNLFKFEQALFDSITDVHLWIWAHWIRTYFANCWYQNVIATHRRRTRHLSFAVAEKPTYFCQISQKLVL